MNLTKKIVSAVALSGVIALAGVQAKGSHGDYDKSGKRLDRMTKYLELTDEQRTNIEAIIADFKTKRPQMDREVKKEKHLAMKERFKALMADPAFDEAAVTQYLNEKSAKKNERQVEQLKMQHAIYQQLTPEQQPKYLKMVKKRMKKMKHKMSKHHRHDGDKHEH